MFRYEFVAGDRVLAQARARARELVCDGDVGRKVPRPGRARAACPGSWRARQRDDANVLIYRPFLHVRVFLLLFVHSTNLNNFCFCIKAVKIFFAAEL